MATLLEEAREERHLGEALVPLLSFTARVISNCPEILRDLVFLYADTRSSSRRVLPDSAVSFAAWEQNSNGNGASYRLYEAGEEVGVVRSAPDAVAHLEYLINAAAMASLTRHLLIHAGVVASAKNGILLPGASGAGKSTLVAALCLAGFSYLSDEVAVLDRCSPVALPFLKAICLKDGGWRVLAASFDTLLSRLDAIRADGENVHYLVAPQRFRPERGAQVRYILLPARRTGAPADLVSVSRATVLAELARHSLNLPRHGWPGVEALARLVEAADCYRLVYHDLRDAVAAISALAGHR